jgi:uncharacterized membrane protein YdbT with pleckstrin-like domain
MGYVENVLQPEEHVVARGYLHWIRHAKALLFALLGIVLLGFAVPSVSYQLVLGTAAVICLVISFALFIRGVYEQWITEIAITNRRVIYKKGFISRQTAEMNIDKIESVLVDQPILGRLLNYGTVSIRGAGEGIENLSHIASPLALRSAITVH